jgi:diaminohydroxyphosphoribosylaminopyrimidine deaminase/5-amino-6-(5-phosphoribosylamino)uracil reductase
VVLACADPVPEAARALEAAGVALLPVRTLDDALRALRRDFGVRSLFVEGGAGLASALWAADRVDRLITFHAPVVLGKGALPAFGSAPGISAADARRLPVLARRALGDDLMTTFAVHRLHDLEER